MKNLRTKLSYALYTLLVAGVLISCDDRTGIEKEFDGKTYEIMEIDGCEYIFYKRSGLNGQTLSHKGNCKNEIHACN